MPRERPNPVSAAYLGLGLALRLWRNAPPIAPGGTAILVHPLPRRFPRPTQTPYRALFFDPRTAGDIGAMRDAEAGRGRRRARDRRLSRGPRLPPAAAVRRVERVRRDRAPARRGADRRAAATRRQPGSSASCPVHGLGAALEMARGRGAERIGYLLAPPYFPIVVAEATGHRRSRPTGRVAFAAWKR